MKEFDPEAALIKVLETDVEKIPQDYAAEAKHLIEHNECGLAYDVLTFGIQRGVYLPTNQALNLIKQTAEVMGITYPSLSC